MTNSNTQGQEEFMAIIEIIEKSTLLKTIVGGVIVIAIVATISFFSKSFRDIITYLIHKFISLFKTEPFEVRNLRKHTTVCANGHLIVLHDFTLKINNKKTSEKFTRMFNVSDSADSCKLPNLTTMLTADKKERFKKYGFWYRSNPENIFDGVKEVDPSKNNHKYKKFYFKFNKNVLINLNKSSIKLMYGYSVLRGQPLTNGYFDSDLISDKDRAPELKSQFQVQYKMNSLEYIFSFIDTVKIKENEIQVYYYPDGIDNVSTRKQLVVEKKDDLYYNKFRVYLKKPKLNSLIQIITPVDIKP